MSLHVVGVRHHSPACARRVHEVLERVRPAFVLIEGPSDMNDRLNELALPDHQPPLALFSFTVDEERRHASYCPFCVHSPEWVALREGLAMGAEVRFMDLPAWAMELHGIENRYGDHALREGFDEALQKAFGVEGYDAFWDDAFELPDPTGLDERLHTYFDELRRRHPASAEDLGRERFMRRYVRWALAQGGDVVVVCGGFHEPVLITAHELEEGDVDDGLEPTAPVPETGRNETWLIPYDEPRLDSFRGYASGLPSPGWYRWTWTEGADAAPRKALQETATRLRKKGQPVSVADTVAAWTQAQALARMRGHATIGRTDVLDAVASTWVKEALDEPVPWSRRGRIGAGTHPVLVEVVSALCGTARGRLDPGTPLPPLVHHVREVWQRLDLQPTDASRTIPLRRGDPAHHERRVALERLVLLGVDAFSLASHTATERVYEVRRTDRTESSLLEAAAWGATLEEAARACLARRALDTQELAELVWVLSRAIEADVPDIGDQALQRLSRAVKTEPSLEKLGLALQRLVGWLRHGGLDPAQQASVEPVTVTAVDRALWLMEGMHGDSDVSLARVDAVAAVRDAALAQLGSHDHAAGVMTRVAADPDAPSDLRGACLGGVASLGLTTLDQAAEQAQQVLGSIRDERLGDFLAGLLRTGREVLTDGEGLLVGVDDQLALLGPEAFLRALPSLRVAFQGLPSRERAQIGRLVAARHGAAGARLTGQLAADPTLAARGEVLEAEASVMLAELGF